MAETATSPTLPSLRELELEVLLREREQQLVDLTVEYPLVLHNGLQLIRYIPISSVDRAQSSQGSNR